MPRIKLVFFVAISAFLSSCALDGEKENPLNGGYSWWSGPYIAESISQNSDVYITGISKKGAKGEQWVAEVEVNQDEVAVVKRVSLNTSFRHDEHNAPAIMTIEDNIIIAATGHANKSSNGANKVLIYTGSDISLLSKQEIRTPFLVTYTQLQFIDGILFLYSRMSDKGYYYITSNNFGNTWSSWQPLFQSGYVKVGNHSEKKEYFVGSNPASNNNNVFFLEGEITVDNTIQISADSLKLEPDFTEGGIRNADIYPLFTPTNSDSSRILDTSHIDSSIALIATHEKNSINETWNLSIAVAKSTFLTAGVYELKNNLSGVLGDRNDELNTGYYVLGAAVVEETNGTLSVVYISKQNQDHQLTLLDYDLSTQTIINETILYESLSEIYRPVVFNKNGSLYVMFNQSKHWNNYLDWKATQKIIQLR